jgi:hypothetical protein
MFDFDVDAYAHCLKLAADFQESFVHESISPGFDYGCREALQYIMK